MFLQSCVMPICGYIEVDGKAHLKQFFGTSFVIGKMGTLITASHVLIAAEKFKQSEKLLIGAVGKGDNGQSSESVILPILCWERAPLPYDVAVAKVEYFFPSTFIPPELDVSEWHDVAAYGYPLQIANLDLGSFDIHLRCQKGYVQRKIAAGELRLAGPNPDAFELSFMLGRGMSGAPLFTYKDGEDVLIGVCVGSLRSEETDEEYLEVLDNGTTYKEKKIFIEQFGVAHQISGILDWKPEIFKNSTLKDMF